MAHSLTKNNDLMISEDNFCGINGQLTTLQIPWGFFLAGFVNHKTSIVVLALSALEISLQLLSETNSYLDIQDLKCRIIAMCCVKI